MKSCFYLRAVDSEWVVFSKVWHTIMTTYNIYVVPYVCFLAGMAGARGWLYHEVSEPMVAYLVFW